MAASVARRMSSSGRSDTAGMPPDSEITSSRVAAANRLRTADGRILRTRRAILSPVVSKVM